MEMGQNHLAQRNKQHQREALHSHSYTTTDSQVHVRITLHESRSTREEWLTD